MSPTIKNFSSIIFNSVEKTDEQLFTFQAAGMIGVCPGENRREVDLFGRLYFFRRMPGLYFELNM
jgi:hypothetical protein